eukprot:TRINITY_DN2186_c0_g1_i3.p1 TRINITY_DN2186_c0_g1~~TRINITY_DN2186_c0_g1_i3.p1  ORF type:complete len:551 (-),score=75.65 TRINITY_DN2186_c0_g1_i3:34-1686(-)
MMSYLVSDSQVSFEEFDYSTCLYDQIPSALQVRIGGIKGMLVVGKYEGNPDSHIWVRPSMIKYPEYCPDNKIYVSILKEAVAPARASLNVHYIFSLLGLGIKEEYIEYLYNKEIEYISKINTVESIAIKMVKDPFNLSLIHCGFLNNYNTQLFLRSTQKNLYESLKNKPNIKLRDAANFFGVADPTGTLNEGEVYCCLSKSNREQVFTGPLLILRSPCYFASDARCVNAVHNPYLSHLKNVLVFSVKGKRPIPDECGGGDLDGDKYFVTWDTNLIPSIQIPALEPEDLTGGFKNKSSSNNITCPGKPVDYFESNSIEDYIEFYTEYRKKIGIPMGTVSNFHKINCDINGINDENSIALGKLFQKYINYVKRPIESDGLEYMQYKPTHKPNWIYHESDYRSDSVFQRVYDKLQVQKMDDSEPAIPDCLIPSGEIQDFLDNLERAPQNELEKLILEAINLRKEYGIDFSREIRQASVQKQYEDFVEIKLKYRSRMKSIIPKSSRIEVAKAIYYHCHHHDNCRSFTSIFTHEICTIVSDTPLLKIYKPYEPRK